ncbi:hypothetical protein [Metabacillus litoralis]|uniref:hypothetical protein n=1 Tax=Metabacillus litoralis TaxID=152268 RepID=UPI00203BE8EA|nr:hypothetical protein [Metabacillus litoralis]MCM3413560.1 hypothetical protein [Metabacillus litoralis]
MKKKFLLLGLAAFVLSGCEELDLNYQGEIRTESEVEEIISDQLEVENPELDIEVDIYEEVED